MTAGVQYVSVIGTHHLRGVSESSLKMLEFFLVKILLFFFIFNIGSYHVIVHCHYLVLKPWHRVYWWNYLIEEEEWKLWLKYDLLKRIPIGSPGFH